MRRLTSTADAWTATATVGVLVLAVALPVSTLATFGFYPGGYFDTLVPRWQIVLAWLLVAVMAPLHVRHVWHGVRDELPPHGVPTFAVMLAALVAGELVLGHVWTFMASLLIASALLVFRPPWSLAWATALILASYPLGTEVFGEGGWYVTVSVAFRSAVLFTLVWLVAGVHRLRVAREVLAGRATARERARVDAELLSTLHVDLERIEAGALRARSAVAVGDPGSARDALVQVTGDARATLAAARTVVADMRQASSRRELQAAARLLAAPDGRQPDARQPDARQPGGWQP
jgi:two-component system sensor histidine kinase DesK